MVVKGAFGETRRHFKCIRYIYKATAMGKLSVLDLTAPSEDNSPSSVGDCLDRDPFCGVGCLGLVGVARALAEKS